MIKLIINKSIFIYGGKKMKYNTNTNTNTNKYYKINI